MLAITAYLLLFASLVVGVSLAIQNHRYRSWPPYEWQQRVANHVSRLRARQTRLQGAGAEFERRAEQLDAEYFDRHLKSIPLRRLSEFPGIGSGTLDRLEQSGWRNFADAMRHRPDSIRGIGPSRANDIVRAVQFLAKAARSQFDAGGCPAAHEYRSELESLRRDEESHARLRQKELAAIDAALRKCEPILEVAERVTFWAFVRNQRALGLTDELFERPLPEPVALAEPVVEPPKPVAPRPPEPRANRATAQKASAVRSSYDQETSSPRRALVQSEPIISPPISFAPAPVHPLLSKLRSFVEFGFVVAKSDGKVAKAERSTIREFVGAKFGHDFVLVRHIDPLMEQIECAVADEIATLVEICRLTNGDERKELYLFAVKIADASGDRNRREEAVLARIVAAFGLAPSSKPATPLPQPREPVASDESFRRLLEIPPNATIEVELIRRRYRLLTERLDPAKAAALGAEFQAMAETKRDQVRRAAEALLAPFAVPLEAPQAPQVSTDLRHNPDLDDFMGG